MSCSQCSGVYVCDDLTDVWEMIRNPNEGRNYTGFETPTLQDLKKIESGNVVKLSRGINKFFVEIVENEPCFFALIGIVVSGDLAGLPFQEGDNIRFLYRNVYSIN